MENNEVSNVSIANEPNRLHSYDIDIAGGKPF